MQTDELAISPPRTPSVTSPEHRLLTVLSSGQSIDQRDWLRMRAGWRLADAVHRARRLGWSINTKHIELSPKVRIASYSLEYLHRGVFRSLRDAKGEASAPCLGASALQE